MDKNGNSNEATRSFERGNKHPYDTGAGWFKNENSKPPKAKDWAHKAARGVLADLLDRHIIKWGFDNIDLPVRKDIVNSIAAIIRVADRERIP